MRRGLIPRRRSAVKSKHIVAIVELKGLRKSYNIGLPTEQEVLHDIELVVREGEFAALIGPSGSGKSTLLNILGLLEQATSGTYRLAGQDVTALDDDASTRARHTTLGFIFQFHHLLPAFSAIENVMLPAFIGGQFDGATRARGAALLDAVGLNNAYNKKPAELSGGMQQRVAIARSLARSPKLVLADEPTGNLDTHSSDSIFELMRRFNREQGTAFLVVTHDPRLAARCDRIIELVDGSIASDRVNTPAG